MLRVATLGPAGTNHELVTKRYLAFHDVADYEVVLVDSFAQGISSLKSGEVEYLVQCAVHPDTPATLGGNFKDIFAVDSFISASKPLAIVTRREVSEPRSIGVLLPANERYTDLSQFERKISYPSLPIIFAKLLQGEFDSALVYKEYADKHPDAVRVDEVIGSPDDVWVVYGRAQMAKNGILAWHDSPTVGSCDSARPHSQRNDAQVLQVHASGHRPWLTQAFIRYRRHLHRHRSRASSRRLTHKPFTTSESPESGLLEGVTAVLSQAGLALSDDVFIHGTTLATNAILERRGARTALVATEGFRDILVIGTESRYDQYDLYLEKPYAARSRAALRFHDPGERRTAQGRIYIPLDEAGIRARPGELRRE